MTDKELIQIILLVYIIITRSMIFGYFLKDKKEYRFDLEDYFEYFIKFIAIELYILLPIIAYPFFYAICWILEKIQKGTKNER